MNPDDLAREHLTIALFCRNRVFPALDEFQVAHKLQVSVDGAVYCMMAARLMDQGHSKADLFAILENLATAKEQHKKTEETEILTKTESVETVVSKSADIIKFQPRK